MTWSSGTTTTLATPRIGPPGAPGDAAPEWVIEGKQVSLEGQFTGPDGADAGLGVLNATCP
jgi:hypothetical protein